MTFYPYYGIVTTLTKEIEMINIPKNGVTLSNKFLDMIDFFNKLERNMEYPNCEGYLDQKRLLEQAQLRFNDIVNR